VKVSSPSAGKTAERWLALVPTLGRSPHFADSVAALRREGGRVLVIAPRGIVLSRLAEDDEGVSRLETGGELGFAAANVAGLAAAPRTEFVALVNDDAVIDAGWAARLVAELDAHPEAASAQGVVLQWPTEADLVDGAGLAWNRWWQAVQRGRSQKVAAMGTEPHEIFGVSATAAIYRRSALDQVGCLFDEQLGSYYEDVDLAVRLRAAGWTARCVPAARARHAGSTTGRSRGAARLVRRNRYAVLGRALGAGLLPRLPGMMLRDAIDAGRALGRGDLGGFASIAAGTVAGLAGLAAVSGRRLGKPTGLLSAAELRRWTP
jgi:GT2 family glycosyltransferase